MSVSKYRLSRPHLSIPHYEKRVDNDLQPAEKGGLLTPDLQPSTPLSVSFSSSSSEKQESILSIGDYFLVSKVEGPGPYSVYNAIHCQTQEEYTCKVIPVGEYRNVLAAYWRLDSQPGFVALVEVIIGATEAYAFFPKHHGDLHSYIRDKRRLRESEAIRLFSQIASTVKLCHENGIVLRDLKLRKFVFQDPNKSQLVLDGLEDTCVLSDESDDRLADKHGCPAYVSPEILSSGAVDVASSGPDAGSSVLSGGYSGRAADLWSLGVMLYTMLIGRYPFTGGAPAQLFTKIRRGQYSVPDSVSSRARCLIRQLLRRDASERICAGDVLLHPWFSPVWPPRVSPPVNTVGGATGSALGGATSRTTLDTPPAPPITGGDQYVPCVQSRDNRSPLQRLLDDT